MRKRRLKDWSVRDKSKKRLIERQKPTESSKSKKKKPRDSKERDSKQKKLKESRGKELRKSKLKQPRKRNSIKKLKTPRRLIRKKNRSEKSSKITPQSKL